MDPQNREEVARSLIESLGEKLKGFWFTLGDYDVVEVATLPDNVSATALSMAVLAGGAIKMFKNQSTFRIGSKLPHRSIVYYGIGAYDRS